MKVVIRYILFPIILLMLFNFLEYGFSWARWDQLFYPILLTSLTVIIFFKTRLRKFFLLSALFLLGVMVLTYLLGQLDLANLIGSFSFALLIIVASSYIPKFIKEGFIEKF